MQAFRHEALLYEGEREFLAGTLPFIRDSVAADEPILVVVAPEKIELLRSQLDGHADRVLFADMTEVGANPARIIPAWHDFVEANSAPGRRLRGIGEPIGPDRGPAELVECHRHESLLNLAFAESRDFWLLCPYDTSALDRAEIDRAQRNHPYVVSGDSRVESFAYGGPAAAAAPFDDPLPAPSHPPKELHFHVSILTQVRAFVAEHAARAGAPPGRVDDFVMAVNEIATNSVRHAGGRGLLRVWRDAEAVICEVRDRGVMDEPLAGRRRPEPIRESGQGLWLANQLCELVQVRSFSSGTAVRLHLHV